jgi:hypothetical protein
MNTESIITSDTQADHTELLAIDRMLGVLPDDLLVVHSRRAGRIAAVEFRVRAAAAFQCLSEMIAVVEALDPSRTKAELMRSLRKWRAARARISDRLRGARVVG